MLIAQELIGVAQGQRGQRQHAEQAAENDAQREETGLRHGRGRFQLLRRQKEHQRGRTGGKAEQRGQQQRPNACAEERKKPRRRGGREREPREHDQRDGQKQPEREGHAAHARAAGARGEQAEAQRQHQAGQQMAVWQERLLGERRARGQQQRAADEQRKRQHRAEGASRRFGELPGRGKADDPAQQQRGHSGPIRGVERKRQQQPRADGKNLRAAGNARRAGACAVSGADALLNPFVLQKKPSLSAATAGNESADPGFRAASA